MKYVIDENTLKGMADAVREKEGSSALIPVAEIASRVLALPSGGGLEGIDVETGTFTLYEDLICAKSDGHNIYAIEHHLGKTPCGFNLFIENAVVVSQGTLNNIVMCVQPWFARNINNPLVWCFNSVYRTNGDSGAYASTNLSTNCAFPISEADKANQMVYADENNIYIGNKNSPNTYQYILRGGNTYRWIAWSPKE